jgi:hypothetical protein
MVALLNKQQMRDLCGAQPDRTRNLTVTSAVKSESYIKVEQWMPRL